MRLDSRVFAALRWASLMRHVVSAGVVDLRARAGIVRDIGVASQGLLASRTRKGCAALGCALVLLAAGASGANAAFPGGNGRIAYGAQEEDCAGIDEGCNDWRDVIETVLPTGEGRRVLVQDGSDMAFSPDGRWIAYTTSEVGAALVRAEGPEKERVLIDLAGYPEWAPAGDRLVGHGFDEFVDGLAILRIYHRKRGGSRRMRSRRLARGLYPAWSTRNRIAFFRHDGLYVIRPDGTGLRRISADPAIVGLTARPVGGQATEEVARHLDWSPDGRWLVFEGPRLGAAIRPPLPHDVGVRSIFKIRADGTGLRHLADDGQAPSFSPDGRSIVFNKLQVGLMVMGSDGSQPREIPRAEGMATDWQPLPSRSSGRPSKGASSVAATRADEAASPMSTRTIALIITALLVLAALAGMIYRIRQRLADQAREHH